MKRKQTLLHLLDILLGFLLIIFFAFSSISLVLIKIKVMEWTQYKPIGVFFICLIGLVILIKFVSDLFSKPDIKD